MSYDGKLNVREKICYGLGDSSVNIFMGMTMMFLPYFYTDVLGISAAAMGVLFIVVRLFDAFYDPFIGSIADRTRSKYGSYRPYLLYLAIPYGLSCLLVFLTPDLSFTGKLIYASITYLFLILMYATTVVPYIALLAVLTPDPMERLSVNAWRFPLAKMAILTCSIVVPMFVSWYGKANEAHAYMIAMSFIGALAAILMLACFLGTKERYQPKFDNNHTSFWKQLAIILKMKPVVIFYAFFVTTSIAFAIKGSMTIYFVKYFLKFDDAFVSILLSASAIAGIIAPVIAIILIKRKKLSKLATLKYSQIAAALSALALYFTHPEQIYLSCSLLVLSVLFAEMGAIISWALPADCTDYCEKKSGLRMSGVIAAGTLFSLKLGMAIAGGMVGLVLSASGYKAGIAVSDEILHSIMLLIAVIPAIFHAISYGLLLVFSLKDENSEKKSMSEIESVIK